MNTPLVSVVVTNYNYADYISEAIDSALNQTYENIDVIVINDGSTDNSEEVIGAYEKHKRVTIVSRENKGVICTRNEGVRRSKGEFVIQLDADDILDSEYVEKCVRKAEKEKLDIVYTQARVFGRADFVTEFIDFDLEKLKHDNFMHASALVRKAKLKVDPYDQYLDKLGNEDWDIFLDLCLDGARAGLVDEPLLNYRKHTDRQSRADKFEGVYREMLVRHHIWSKQNTKHPDQLWYFSSQINNLLACINLYDDDKRRKVDLRRAKELIDLKDARIARLESRDIVTIVKKTKARLTGKAS